MTSLTFNLWQTTVTVLFALLNTRTLYLFYADKQRSKRREYRISEKKLLFSAALMGGAGAWTGSLMFRHKTRKKVFRYSLPVFFIFTIIIYLLLLLQ